MKAITHFKDLPTPVHESLWYTNEEWSDMESRNTREVYEQQMAAEYGYAELTEHGYYEYLDRDSDDLDEEDDLDDDEDDDDEKEDSEGNTGGGGGDDDDDDGDGDGDGDGDDGDGDGNGDGVDDTPGA